MKYNPAYPEQARKLCALLGATDEVLAEYFGVCRNTILNWRNEYPEFAEACRDGKLRADVEVLEAGHRRAVGFSHDGKYFPPDPTCFVWWTKNRLGWRDKGPEGDVEPEDVVRKVRDALDQMRDADGA